MTLHPHTAGLPLATLSSQCAADAEEREETLLWGNDYMGKPLVSNGVPVPDQNVIRDFFFSFFTPTVKSNSLLLQHRQNARRVK